MAQIITVSIIVDEVKVDDCRAVVENAMKEALEPYLTSEVVVDYEITHQMPLDDNHGDAICNETYCRGEAFKDWMFGVLPRQMP